MLKYSVDENTGSESDIVEGVIEDTMEVFWD